MKNNWQKDIHDRLGNYEKDAPDGLWEDICREMSDENGGYRRNGKPSLLYRIRRTAGIVAAASVALFLGYSIYSEYIDNEHGTSKMARSQMGTTLVKSSDNESIVTDNRNIVADNSIVRNNAYKECYSVDNAEASLPLTNDNDSLDIMSDSNKFEEPDRTEDINTSDHEEDVIRENNNKQVDCFPKNNNYANLVAYNHDVGQRSSSSRASHWAISTSAMGTLKASKTITSIGDPVISTGPDDSDWEDNPMLDINIFNQGKEVKTEYKHRLPVHICVKVAYALNERLSIESGLTYTRLASDMKDGSQENYFTGEQKLNYVGIPVNVKYNIFAYKRLNLYGSAGVLAEKCVSGYVTEEYVINNATKKSETFDIDSKPLQMSVNAAAGVQFNVLDNIGIYAEPGVSYHFDDGSSLQTIYKEKPLNFNLNFGVRYTIDK
jgi:hypothetical protein